MLQVEPIPAFQDNYLWLLTRAEQKLAAIVDPGDATPVLDVLKRRSLSLCAIMITHHHADHTGGIGRLIAEFPDARVYGPANENISGIQYKLTEGDAITLPGLDAAFEILAVPGHTLDHIAYVHHADPKLVFCGDTLFSAGCGRLFEGTAQQMHHSLTKLRALPEKTLVYCAHEYTMANLKFAVAVEPHNQNLQAHVTKCEQLRAQGVPTLPSNMGLEQRINPFLRYDVESVAVAAREHSGSALEQEFEVLAAVRQWKDQF